MSSSEAVTRNIRVHVEAEYAAARSNPMQNQWFFLYTVTITNEGPDTVRLISRHWLFTDAMDQVNEVRGLGVVGKQPVLAKDQSFEYTSGCSLATPFGSMHGTYQMQNDRQQQFDVEIALVTLSVPYETVH